MQHILVILSALCWLSCESLTPLYHGLSVADQEFYILPVLVYENSGLEPYIDEATVEAHHEGHVNNYRKKMNGLLKAWREKVGFKVYYVTGTVSCLLTIYDCVHVHVNPWSAKLGHGCLRVTVLEIVS